MLIGQFQGNMARVELYQDKLIIYRNFAGRKSQREIYLTGISSIEIKKPGLSTGYIQFHVSGSESIRRSSITNPMEMSSSVLYDENSIGFNGKDNYEKAVAFVKRVDSIRNAPTAASTNHESSPSIADELLKFKQLLDAGAISEAEFNQQKERLLGKTSLQKTSTNQTEIIPPVTHSASCVEPTPVYSTAKNDTYSEQHKPAKATVVNNINIGSKKKPRKGMRIFAIFFFVLAFVSIVNATTDLYTMPAFGFCAIIGLMFFILSKSPKEYPRILGRDKGMKKSAFVVLSIFVAFMVFASILANIPSVPEDNADKPNTNEIVNESEFPRITNTPSPTHTPTVAPTDIPEADVTEEIAYTSLTKGASGDEVRNLQTRLKELGYLDGSIDGIYGQQTVNAVSKFQENNNLEVTGNMSANDFATLYSANVVFVSASAEKAETTTMADVKAWYSKQMSAVSQDMFNAFSSVDHFSNLNINSSKLRFGNNDGWYECHYTMSFTCRVDGALCNGEARAFLEYLGDTPEWFHLEIWRDADWATLLEHYDDSYDQKIEDYYKYLEETYGG